MPGPAKRRRLSRQAPQAVRAEQSDVLAEGLPEAAISESPIPKQPFEDGLYNVTTTFPLQSQTQAHSDYRYMPITKTDDEIYFQMPAGDSWVDLSKTYIELEVRIVDHDGSAIAHDRKFQIVDNLAVNMWKRKKVEMMGVALTPSNDQSYASTLTSYVFGKVKDSQGYAIQGLTGDTPYCKDSIEVATNHATFNALAAKRRALFFDPTEAFIKDGTVAPTKTYTGVATLRLPFADLANMFHTERALIPGVALAITLYTQDNNFVFLVDAGDDVPKLVINHATLVIRYLKPEDSIGTYYDENLFKNNLSVNYDFQTTLFEKYRIPTGTSQFEKSQVWQNNLPNVGVFALVQSTARLGNKAQNPFNFDVHGLKSIQVFVGSKAITPVEIKKKNNYYAGYGTIVTALGPDMASAGTQLIDRYSWPGGNALYAFTFTPDGYYRPWSRKEGINTGGTAVNVLITFTSATTSNLDLVCVGYTDNSVKLDGGRNVAPLNPV